MHRTIEIGIIAMSLVFAVVLRNVLVLALVIVCLGGILSSSWAAWKIVAIDRDMEKLRGQVGEMVEWRKSIEGPTSEPRDGAE